MNIALEPNLDLAAARRLKDTLIGALASEGPVTLEAAAVERIGTPAIQVLLAAGERFAADGRRLVVADATEPLRAAFSDLGLAAVLDAMEAPA